jgi:hypothetical protein
MLNAQGVAPVTDSIARYSKEQAGQKDAGLWSFVASFSAQILKTKAPGSASAAHKGEFETPRKVSKRIAAAGAQESVAAE